MGGMCVQLNTAGHGRIWMDLKAKSVGHHTHFHLHCVVSNHIRAITRIIWGTAYCLLLQMDEKAIQAHGFYCF